MTVFILLLEGTGTAGVKGGDRASERKEKENRTQKRLKDELKLKTVISIAF